MTEPYSGSFFTVKDTEQARLLTEPASKGFLEPFLARERSASEAAEMMGCSLNTMIYRIKILLRAGILEVVREEPRKGRPVKVYRSVHDAYFVPFRVMPYATIEERLEVQAKPIFAGLIRSYAAAGRKNERYGHYIFMSENGAMWTSDLLPTQMAGQPVIYSDIYVKLRDEDARALEQELRGLLERALELDKQAKDDPETRVYLNMVALLPFTEAHKT